MMNKLFSTILGCLLVVLISNPALAFTPGDFQHIQRAEDGTETFNEYRFYPDYTGTYIFNNDVQKGVKFMWSLNDDGNITIVVKSQKGLETAELQVLSDEEIKISDLVFARMADQDHENFDDEPEDYDAAPNSAPAFASSTPRDSIKTTGKLSPGNFDYKDYHKVHLYYDGTGLINLGGLFAIKWRQIDSTSLVVDNLLSGDSYTFKIVSDDELLFEAGIYDISLKRISFQNFPTEAEKQVLNEAVRPMTEAPFRIYWDGVWDTYSKKHLYDIRISTPQSGLIVKKMEIGDDMCRAKPAPPFPALVLRGEALKIATDCNYNYSLPLVIYTNVGNFGMELGR